MGSKDKDQFCFGHTDLSVSKRRSCADVWQGKGHVRLELENMREFGLR